jgi:hypothetical protein
VLIHQYAARQMNNIVMRAYRRSTSDCCTAETFSPTVTSIDSISSEDRTKFLAQTPRAFFVLYVGDEARQCHEVVTICDSGGGGSGSDGI